MSEGRKVLGVSTVQRPGGVVITVQDSNVPCRKYNCSACCQGPNRKARLMPELGDKISQYQVEYINGEPHLKMRDNGDCVYLDRTRGCTIYKRRPIACRYYDCRLTVDSFDEPEHIRIAARRIINEERRSG